MYGLQDIVDRILSSKTTGALLDEMREELRLVGVGKGFLGHHRHDQSR